MGRKTNNSSPSSYELDDIINNSPSENRFSETRLRACKITHNNSETSYNKTENVNKLHLKKIENIGKIKK